MNKEQLKKQIFQKELQIKKIHLNLSSDEVTQSLYNSLILEKAILKKELEECNKNYFIESCKKIFTPKQKLICDYWKK